MFRLDLVKIMNEYMKEVFWYTIIIIIIIIIGIDRKFNKWLIYYNLIIKLESDNGWISQEEQVKKIS